MHRLARERLRIRTIQAREEVSSASTMCLDASVGSALPVRRRWTSFSMTCWRHLAKTCLCSLFQRSKAGQATKSKRTRLPRHQPGPKLSTPGPTIDSLTQGIIVKLKLKTRRSLLVK